MLLDLIVQIPLRDHLLPQRRVQPGALARAVQPAQVDKQRESGEFARAVQRRQSKGIRLNSRAESVCREENAATKKRTFCPGKTEFQADQNQYRIPRLERRTVRIARAGCQTPPAPPAAAAPPTTQSPSAPRQPPPPPAAKHRPSRPSGNHACRFRIFGHELVLCLVW